MAVNVQAGGGGGGKVSLGGQFDLSQIGLASPAGYSAVIFVVLLAVVILIAMGLR